MSKRKTSFEHYLSSKEDRAKSLEKKAQLIKSRSSRGKTKKKTRAKKQVGSVKKAIQLFDIDQQILAEIQNENHFLTLDNDHMDEEEHFLSSTTASSEYELLAHMITQTMHHKGVSIVLAWPYGFEWIGLSHILANRRLSSTTDEACGIRIGLYPYNRSVDSRYRRCFLDADRLISEARRASEIGLQRDQHETTDRQLALLALNDLDDELAMNRNPSLRDYAPRFKWNDNKEKWEKIGDMSFKRAHTSLWNSGHSGRRQSVENFANIQDDPDKSIDGIFNIGRKERLSNVYKILSGSSAHVDLLVVDARTRCLKSMKNWRDQLSKVVHKNCESEEMLPTLLLVDDVLVFSDLCRRLQELQKKTTSRKHQEYKIQSYPIFKQTSSIWTKPLSQLYSLEDRTVFLTQLSGKYSLDNIRRINKCASAIGVENPEAAQVIRMIGGFMRTIVDSPVGQEAVHHWADEVTHELSASQRQLLWNRLLWSGYKLDVRKKLDELGVLNFPDVTKALAAADVIGKDNYENTEIQLSVELLVKEAFEKKKKLLIIVPAARHTEAVRDGLLAKLKTFGENFLEVRAQSDTFTFSNYECVVVAGAVEKMIPELLLSDTLPEEVHLLISAYASERISRILSELVAIDNFKTIHKRASEILYDLEELIQSMDKIGNLFDFFDPYAITPHSDQSDHEYVEPYAIVHLQRYGGLPVGKHSTLIRQVVEDDKVSYLAVGFEDINEGDSILLLEEGLRERMAYFLKSEGEDMLKESKAVMNFFFSTAQNNVETYFSASTRTVRANNIHEKMYEIEPELADEIRIENVNRWLKSIEENSEIAEESNSPGQAKSKQRFVLFSRALQVSQNLAEAFYDDGIRKYRTGRIFSGRKLSSRLRAIITNAIPPEKLDITPSQKDTLLSMASENVYEVDSITFTKD